MRWVITATDKWKVFTMCRRGDDTDDHWMVGYNLVYNGKRVMMATGASGELRRADADLLAKAKNAEEL